MIHAPEGRSCTLVFRCYMPLKLPSASACQHLKLCSAKKCGRLPGSPLPGAKDEPLAASACRQRPPKRGWSRAGRLQVLSYTCTCERVCKYICVYMCIYIYIRIYLFILTYLFIYLLTHLVSCFYFMSIYFFIDSLSIYLSIYLCVYLSLS